jgi:hypothetical protein
MPSPQGAPPKKCIPPFIFVNSRRSMKAIVLHMAFAMGGEGGAFGWHQR